MGARRSTVKGFTLIEVLVAVAILAIMILLLGQIATFVSSIWTTGNSDTERRQNQRAVADFIALELRAATLPINRIPGNPKADLQLILNPPSISQKYRNASALFWQAPISGESKTSDLASIGYFVRWTSGGVPQAQLCRFFVNSKDASNYTVYSENEWITDQRLENVAPATPASGYIGLFAENVIGFWALCLRSDGTIETKAMDVYDSRTTLKLPSSIEVSLIQLDARIARRLTADIQSRLMDIVATSGNAQECLSTIQSDTALETVKSGARAYTTRVFLENSR